MSDDPISTALKRGINETSLPHESGHKHVTGDAIYVDDAPVGEGMLEVWPVCSPHARAKILRRDISAAKRMPGIKTVLVAEDVPGLNDVGAVRHDEILLADKDISYHGQIVALVVGETQEACRAAANKVVIEYEPLPAIFTIQDAIDQKSFHTEANHIERGDFERAFADSPCKLEGEFAIGGQDHFYLETQAGWAERGEDGTVFVCSSTQHPSEVQHIVAHLLALPMHSVVVQCPRMGGGFGGKETQAAMFAGAGRARGVENRPQSPRSAQSRPGHDDHRQTASVSGEVSTSVTIAKACSSRRRLTFIRTAAGRSIFRER